MRGRSIPDRPGLAEFRVKQVHAKTAVLWMEEAQVCIDQALDEARRAQDLDLEVLVRQTQDELRTTIANIHELL